ncbi:MAG: hypothetical protein LBR65_01560 [Culturomica sp.]|nr:hypothetical protein [Culturomica sp.]
MPKTCNGGGIKVGDPISRIEPIGLGTPVLQNDGSYHVRRNNADDPLVFEHKEGIITRILFVSSI